MTMREIDLAGFTSCALQDQQAPQLMWVAVADLVIDETYQRALTNSGRKMIQTIAEGWDWTRYQPILIATTLDGRFAVVDGQHRAHAAALCGLTSILAMVVPMTPRQQAQAFTAVNTVRIKPPPSALFRARLAAGDPGALAARDAVAAAGCVLMTYNPSASQRQPGQVFVYALVQAMVANGEGAAVTAGLRAIRDSAQGNEKSGQYGYGNRVYDATVLRSWLPALATNQVFLSLDLAAVFDTIDWDDERVRATTWARRDGGSVAAAMKVRIIGILRAARDDARGRVAA